MIPGLLSSLFLFSLNQFWQSTSDLTRQEQARSAVVLNMAVCFNALISYCSDIMTLSFDKLRRLEQRAQSERETFEISLARLSNLKDAGNNIEGLRKFCRHAEKMSSDAEALSAQLARETFTSNIARFMRYRGFMVKGAALAEFLNRYFVAETEGLNALRTQMETGRKRLYAISAVGMPLVLLGSLVGLYFFARTIFLKVRKLAAKASVFPNLPAYEESVQSLDEFAYLDQILSRTAEEVRNAAELRQSFVQMLAHDMRSPIMATQVYIEILQEMYADRLSKEGRETCQSVKKDLTDVHDFVSDLLTAEKLECEPIELEYASISIDEIVESAQTALMDLADEKDIAISYDAQNIELEADHERFLQALVCFIKASLQGSLPGTILAITAKTSSGNLTVSLKSKGLPVGEKEISNLFDPFRAEGKENSFDLSNGGLNLRIARLILEAHGGKTGGRGDSEGQREYWLTIPLSNKRESGASSSTRWDNPDALTQKSTSGWKDLLESSSFRNCLLVFSAAFILQASWILWLGGRVADSERLASQAIQQTNTLFSLNKLWLELVLANNRMGFYLAANDEAKLALARQNVATAESLIGDLNQLFQQRTEHADTWSNVRSFVADEISSLKSMTEPSEDGDAAVDLGILGSRIERANELNARMQNLSDSEMARLSEVQNRQAGIQDKFQGVITLAIASNLFTMAIIVWLFSKNISARLDTLVQAARQIPLRQPIDRMMSGHDEIYQVYWLLCRAALNLKDSSDQRKIIMQMLADNIGRPLSRVESNLAALSTLLPEDVVEKSRTNLQSASDNIKRLLALVEDLLLLDELEKGSLQVTKQPCSAREIVEASIQSVGGIALKKGIALKNNCVELEFSAERKRLIQVLVNLIGNAVKFSPRGSEIVVQGELRDGRLYLAVIDQGPGLSKQDIEKVFARFYQKDEHKKQGFGLGLSICSLIVRSHGGEITAEGEPGVGSKFIITLPLA